jgi:hypothetical protein
VQFVRKQLYRATKYFITFGYEAAISFQIAQIIRQKPWKASSDRVRSGQQALSPHPTYCRSVH